MSQRSRISRGLRPAFLLLFLWGWGGSMVLGKEKPPIIHRIPLPPKPDYSDLDWLIGEWTGQTNEKSPQGEVHLFVSFDLDKRVMIFREEVALAATEALPESKEAWIGILSQEASGGEFVMRVFSDTGFITRFGVTAEGGTVSFNPEGGEQPPPGWLFRRTLQRPNVGELIETVQVAPPQKAFFDYYTAKLIQKTSD